MKKKTCIHLFLLTSVDLDNIFHSLDGTHATSHIFIGSIGIVQVPEFIKSAFIVGLLLMGFNWNGILCYRLHISVYTIWALRIYIIPYPWRDFVSLGFTSFTSFRYFAWMYHKSCPLSKIILLAYIIRGIIEILLWLVFCSKLQMTSVRRGAGLELIRKGLTSRELKCK